MGTTRAFKNIRLTTHLLTLINIIINLLLLAYFLFKFDYFRVENKVDLGFFDLQVCVKYTIIINIIVSLFGSCAINSKIRSYMKVFMITGFIGMSTLIAFFIFLMSPYKNMFKNQFSIQYIQNPMLRSFVRMTYNCGEYEGSNCEAFMMTKADEIIKIYMIIGIVSFVIDFLIYTLARIAMVVDLSVEERVPEIERNVHVGYDTQSLRQKRFLDPNIKFKTSVIEPNLGATVTTVDKSDVGMRTSAVDNRSTEERK